VREEVTANTCLGTKDKVREKVGDFLRRLSEHTNEVKTRCRTILQAKASAASISDFTHVLPSLASV